MITALFFQFDFNNGNDNALTFEITAVFNNALTHGITALFRYVV